MVNYYTGMGFMRYTFLPSMLLFIYAFCATKLFIEHPSCPENRLLNVSITSEAVIKMPLYILTEVKI